MAKTYGSHAIEALNCKNKTLIAKWGWRLIHEPDPFWHKVIVRIHDSSIFERHTHENCDDLGEWNHLLFSVWTMTVISLFGMFVFIDPWLNDSPSKSSFP